MAQVELSFGRTGLGLELDPAWDVTVVRKAKQPPLTDAAGAVEAALRAPVGSAPLHALAGDAASACILICDVTRPVPNGLLLPAVIRELLAGGMAKEAITVLVATGLHRPNEGEELRELVGDPWVLETVRVVNHFARRDAEHADLGRTSSGTAIRLDRRLVEADLKIAVGLVEPHFMAGWSGGRKLIAPGVAHAETITTFHSARFMEHPRAIACTLAGNPLHLDQLEIVERLGGAHAVNVVLDERRRPTFVNFGEIVASHLDAVAFAQRAAEVEVPERYPVVVTTAAGHPLDLTYYQAIKGMVTPLEILAPGGDLVVAAACAEGLGSAAFSASQGRLVAQGPERFLDGLLEKPRAAIDEWQSEMLLRPLRRGRVHLHAPGLSEEERRLTGVAVVDDLQRCVAACVERAGDPRVAVIPEGPYVVPRYAPPR